MSIVLDAVLCLGGTSTPMPKNFRSVEVELFEDGDIAISGFDEAYHRAGVEFGYEEPLELKLIDYWHTNPEIVISVSLDISHEIGSHIALDWAEHVLPIHKKRFPYDTRPEEAFAAARDYLDDPNEQNDYNLRKMSIEVTKCEIDLPYEMHWERGKYSNISTVHAPNFAARAIARAVSSADSTHDISMYESTVQYASIHARVAVAYSISNISDDEDPRYRTAYENEKAWQVKRFVKAMEIVGQGGKWPPMSVTP